LKPGCRIVGSVTVVWLTTEADDQSSVYDICDFVVPSGTRMLPSIEDRGQADRVTANAIPIALPNPLILTLTLTYDLDF